jgi:hypothetical protein
MLLGQSKSNEINLVSPNEHNVGLTINLEKKNN